MSGSILRRMFHVPDDAGVGVLVLVGEPEGVADLVQGGVGLPGRAEQVPAEVHGPLVGTPVEDLAAQVRPGAVALHEPDPDLGLVPRGHLDERQADVLGLPVVEAASW